MRVNNVKAAFQPRPRKSLSSSVDTMFKPLNYRDFPSPCFCTTGLALASDMIWRLSGQSLDRVTMRFTLSVVTRPTREQTGCWRRPHFPHLPVHHLHHYLVFHLSCFFPEEQADATHSRHLLRAPVDANACFPSVFPAERRFPACQGAASTYLLIRNGKSSLSLMRFSARKSPLD